MYPSLASSSFWLGHASGCGGGGGGSFVVGGAALGCPSGVGAAPGAALTASRLAAAGAAVARVDDLSEAAAGDGEPTPGRVAEGGWWQVPPSFPTRRNVTDRAPPSCLKTFNL